MDLLWPAGKFWISRGLSRYSPMSEVFAPRYLAGLMSTYGYLRSRHLCQTPLNGGEALPRAYLADQLESRNTNTKFCMFCWMRYGDR